MLLMFLGVGLLKGVNVVTTDGCLYAETFVFNFAFERIRSPLVQQVVRTFIFHVGLFICFG